jgi:hypothetical protein
MNLHGVRNQCFPTVTKTEPIILFIFFGGEGGLRVYGTQDEICVIVWIHCLASVCQNYIHYKT